MMSFFRVVHLFYGINIIQKPSITLYRCIPTGEITETATKLNDLAEELKNSLSKTSRTAEDVEFNEEEIKIKNIKKEKKVSLALTSLENS